MPRTLAERLGFGADEKIAVVHVDDLGMCHAANVGGFEAMANGPATCGSVMVPCAWFPEAAARARELGSDGDVGVHLTLNAEWERYRWGPVAGRDRVPSLVDEDGFLPRTQRETLQRAKPEHVAIELRAQLEAALAAGVDVTHLDAHMGTAFFPPFCQAVVDLAREFRLPLWAPSAEPALLERQGMAALASFFEPVARAVRAAGLPVFDGFDADSLGFSDGEGMAHTRKRLDRLQPGVTFFITHAARGGEELAAVTPGDAHAREFERTFHGGEIGRRTFAERGIRTLGMRRVRALLRGEG